MVWGGSRGAGHSALPLSMPGSEWKPELGSTYSPLRAQCVVITAVPSFPANLQLLVRLLPVNGSGRGRKWRENINTA